LQKRVLLLTGKPGVGKTTVLIKVVSRLKEDGYCVGGMISQEACKNNLRVGFKILDVNSGKSGWLAKVNQKSGPRIGKYRVNIENIDIIGAQAIADAMANCDIIAIDEIGPMELFSDKFKEVTRKALESRKPVIAVVHWKAKDELIGEAKSREDTETYTVTQENRNKMSALILLELYKPPYRRLYG
jgi:nucleoside-triphosphatase